MGPRRFLLFGYGNPGRCDDGLGPALAQHFETVELPQVTVDADYQLQVEVAAAAAQHDLVIFVDAACSGAEPFDVHSVQPGEGLTFSTHSVSPADVMGIARRLFGAECPAFIVGIRGYDFDGFGEQLSERAIQNLREAIRFLEAALRGDAVAELLRSACRSESAAAAAVCPTAHCGSELCKTASM
jgi:hydrogenase maturation protease